MPGPPCFSVCFLWLSYHISGPLNMLSGRSIGSISQCILVLGPVAGVFADRWEKRLIMMSMDILRAVLIILLILVTGVVPLPFLAGGRLPILWQLGALYGIIFLTSICDQFFHPANMALIGHIVEEPDQARASGLNEMTGNLAIVV